MDNATVNKIFACFAKNDPQPATELKYHNHFELLVAVILSAQATDVSVNKATVELFKVANTPQKMLTLGEHGLKNYIKTIGLYNSKAKNIILTAGQLVHEYDAKVPNTLAELVSLPGVGRKTANVVLNAAFGHPTLAVDTHVLRVAKRIGLTQASTPLAVEAELEELIPPKYKSSASHWLILHGRYVCKARKPLCTECTIQKYCEYPNKNL